MGSRRISNYAFKLSDLRVLPRRTIDSFKFEQFRPDHFWLGGTVNSPAGPNYVDQTWSGRTDFFPGPIFSLQSLIVNVPERLNFILLKLSPFIAASFNNVVMKCYQERIISGTRREILTIIKCRLCQY